MSKIPQSGEMNMNRKSEAYNLKIEKQDTSSRYTVIKDIPLLEDIIRRTKSQEISFDRLYSSIQDLT